MTLRAPALLAALSLALTACPTEPQVEETLALTPAALTLVAGDAQVVAAKVVSPGGTMDATAATWRSSDPAVATVTGGAQGSATATVQAVAAGACTLTVTQGLLSATLAVTVTARPVVLSRLELTPALASLARGTTLQLAATGVSSDATTQDLTAAATWSSSAPATLTVSAAGLVTGVAPGVATVTAAVGAVSASLEVTVTAATVTAIEVTPATPSLARGTHQALTATARLSDTTTQDVTLLATWSTADAAVATVSETGDVTAVGVGTTAVSATVGGVSGSTDVTVTAAVLAGLTLAPEAPSVPRGLTQPFTATGTFSDGSTQDLTTRVTWSSSAPAVASVEAASGLALAVDVGATIVTATSGAVSASTTLTVTAAALQGLAIAPLAPSVPRGLTQPLTATGTFSDGSTQDVTAQVTWGSADTTVAIVSNAAGSEGLLTALAQGTTAVTATHGAVTASATATVTAATLVSIAVTPPSPTVGLGGTQPLTATGTYSDGATQDLTAAVTWTSSDPSVALVSNAAGTEGLLTTVREGSTTVSASLSGVTGTAVVTVTAPTLLSIEVTPATPSVVRGATEQLTAIGSFSDGSTQDLSVLATWASSNEAAATVDVLGLVTAVAEGATSVSATYAMVSGSTTVTVTAPPTNVAPVAVDDAAGTPEDTALVLAGAALLGNDVDADGPSALTVTAVAAPSAGQVGLAAGTVTFTPPPDFAGVATFEYTVSDGALTDVGLVTVTVAAVNDAPVAGDDGATTSQGVALALPAATLLANDVDVDGPALALTAVQSPVNGTVQLAAGTVTFTPAAGFTGVGSFEYAVSDGTASDVGLVTVTVTAATGCGDGVVGVGEQCDDQDLEPGDGCSAACAVEAGWACTGAPSVCATTCGDAVAAGDEQCDDGNAVDTDGCTTQCVSGRPCTAAALPAGTAWATDPATGTCYVHFAGATTWAAAQTACVGLQGHLATVTSAGEQARVQALTPGVAWLGAADDAADTDAVFDWVTAEAWAFTAFAPGEPDDDAGLGGAGECLARLTTGAWADTNCDFVGYVEGRVCELPANPCGDGLVQTGEACDDGSRVGGDGCSATCTVEAGAQCTGTAPTVCAKLVINEVDYDQPGPENSGGLYEFVEVLNAGTGPANLADVVLVLINGATASEYYFDASTGAANVAQRLRLAAAGVPGNLLPPGGIVVAAPAGQFSVAGFPTSAFQLPVVTPVNGWLQNGAPDAVALVDVGTSQVLDACSYEGVTPAVTLTGVTGPLAVTEGSAGAVIDTGVAEGLSRFPDGRDTQDNAADFALRPVSPGRPNP